MVWVGLASPARALTVSAVGDILLWYGDMAGTLHDVSATARTPWDTAVYPFGRVEPYLQGLVFGNLEGPLTGAPTHRFKPKWMRYYFKSPAREAVAALKQGGFRVLNLANNHSMDSGKAGLRDTLDALREGGILGVGAGMTERRATRPLVVDSAQGGSVVFLAYCAIGPKGTFAKGLRRAGAARADAERMLADVRREASTGLPVLVSVHWGVEQKRDLPVAEPLAWQKELAHRLIDAGAAAVLGHHTHAVSRFEEYHGGLIAYSLGNFLFSGARYAERHRSVILRLEVQPGGVGAWNLVPVNIDAPGRDFQPAPMRTAEGEDYLARLLGGRTYARYGPLPGAVLQASAGPGPAAP